MASWQDGPRYAPQERPDAFAEPSSGISLAAPELPPEPQIPPLMRPEAYEQTPGIPLEKVAVSEREPRNPTEPYAMMASSLTDTANPSKGARDPSTPFAIIASAVTSTGLVGPRVAPVEDIPRVHPVAAKDLLVASYPPLLIAMAVGGFVSWVAIVAIAASAFLLAPRVSFRNRQLRIVFYVTLGVGAILWLIFRLINASTTINMDLNITVVAQIACWALIAVDVILQYVGLRNGEHPSPSA